MASDLNTVIYLFEKYRLDASHRMLYRDGEALALPPKAIETLLALVERRGDIVGKDELMRTIWADTVVEESNLAHYFHLLRKTLGTHSDGKPYIETLRRRGYRFTAEVRVINGTAAPQANGNAATTLFEPKNLPFLERENFQPKDAGGQPTPASLTADADPPGAFPTRRIFLSATVSALFFAFAMLLYFQFQPPKTNSQTAVSGEISVTPLTNGDVVLSATISPDGKYFVYHDTEGDINRLWLQQIGQTERIEIIPSGERSINGKTFSPNGEFVYFVSREKGEPKFGLFRVPTHGGALTKILNDVKSPVSFSPDGSEMAFIRYDEKTKEHLIVTAPADGGTERILLASRGNETFFSGGAWSPDGKLIAFGSFANNLPSGEGKCSLAALEVQTGAVKNLTSEKWDNCFRMTWTPDGEGIVFIGTRAGESYTTRRDQVYFLSLATGLSRRVTTDGSRYQDQSLGIAADNSLLAVPSKMLSQIWVMDASGDSRSAVQLTNGQADGRAGIAPLPDGRIGYITRNGDNLSIRIMNADGSNQRQINSRLPFVEELRATPDGRYFVFSARRDGFSHLYRMDTDGTNLKQLTSGDTYEVDSTVSPDSRWVFYGSNFLDNGQWKTRLQKTAIESGETVQLKLLENTDINPSISPDGKIIAGITGAGLKFFSADDGAALDILERSQRMEMASGAKWTPDGKALVYQVYRDNSVNLWQQTLDKTAPRPLTNFTKGYVYFHAFSSDGTRLYIARGYHVRDAVLIKNWE